MWSMKTACVFLAGLAVVAAWAGAACADEAAKAGPIETAKRPLVQVAILLDTSNSMDGLISQAKSQLWRIVNEIAGWKKGGVQPDIQVALFEYGKSSLPAAEGFLRMVVPLTADLDKVSEGLFGLGTNGGDEFCGQVIDATVGRLTWSADPADLRMVFIAGNEPFTQGPVDFRAAVGRAAAKGIVVNTIHCGSYDEGERTGWGEGARLAGGQYAHIDQNARVAHVAAPQDAEIARLGAELSGTYVAFGKAGKEKKARQEAQDRNAEAAAPAAALSRTAFKASGAYGAGDWDLVDAVATGRATAGAVAEEDLPAEMKGMDAAKRDEYVRDQQRKRADIQARIRKLNAEREAFVTAKQAEAAAGGERTLDAAMIGAVRTQAATKQFSR
ncbi:MAG: VWA domain-containing protein [Deltaproteobacteria bacterium]|nr:VWA domain-containing protein [Deltaproteobacteria bacterium]